MNQGHTVGDRICEARKRRGLSQRELAQLSGVSLSLVSKLEQGERQDTRTETLRKLAVSLDVTTMVLLGGAPGSPPVTSEPAWAPVRQALADPTGDSVLEPVTEAGLSKALASAVKLYTLDLRAPAKAFVARYRVPYPVAFDPAGRSVAPYGLVGLPVTFFVSPSGTRILGENVGALTSGKLRAILHRLYGVT